MKLNIKIFMTVGAFLLMNKNSSVLKDKEFPHYVKYMGSKTKIIKFLIKGLNKVNDGSGICDIFAGSCSLSGTIGHCTKIFSNDIQNYSSTLALAYLSDWKDESSFLDASKIIELASQFVNDNIDNLPKGLAHRNNETLKQFDEVEKANQRLINNTFPFNWHLFVKYYSGTWWSAYQCLWIDAIRMIAETQKQYPHYNTILASLMYAMAYCSQGTGHYAQYRDPKTNSSMKDINIYRKRKIADYFLKKYEHVCAELQTSPPKFQHEITVLDYKERLKTLPECTIYADPPYCFVHYSRFYHAIETLVLYDYPDIQIKGGNIVKGRYRINRHQSPFCIRTQVNKAFEDLFSGVNSSGSNLVLSYSDSGMISFESLTEIANKCMPEYQIENFTMNHMHMTMGRKNDRERAVKERLLIAGRK